MKRTLLTSILFCFLGLTSALAQVTGPPTRVWQTADQQLYLADADGSNVRHYSTAFSGIGVDGANLTVRINALTIYLAPARFLNQSGSAYSTASAASAYAAFQASIPTASGSNSTTSLTGLDNSVTNYQNFSQVAGVVAPISASVVTHTSQIASLSANEETRALKVYTIEPYVTTNVGTHGAGSYLPASGTLTVFSDLSGPGNIENIQLALAGGDGGLTSYDSYIDIYVDNLVTPVASIPVGLFFLNYGAATIFLSKNLSLTKSGGDWGGVRNIFIPYHTGCVIKLRNLGTATPDIFSQVEYRTGGFPSPAIYGSRKRKFYCYVQPLLGATATTAFSSFTVLPQVTGKRGLLESVQIFSVGASTTNTTYWLEGDPIITTESGTYKFGGTEDFFGMQYYGTAFANGTARSNIDRGMPQIGGLYVSLYRFFDKPFLFDSSIIFVATNGQQSGGATPQGGGAPPTTTFATMCIYYTDEP